jgi:ribose transport system permease protein
MAASPTTALGDFVASTGRGLRGKTFVFPLLLLIAAVAANYYLQPNMLQTRVLNGTLRSLTPLIFLAVAQTLVIVNGNIDLSIGAIMSLVAAFMVTRLGEDSGAGQFLLVLGGGVVIGMLAGAVNGALASFARLPSFITTYATSYVYGGVALWILPRPGGSMPLELARGYRSTAPLGLPIGLWIIAAILALWLLLRSTRFGTFLYAIGGNPRSAFASGVPVNNHRFVTYAVAGGIAACAALFLTLSTGSSDARIGDAMTLNSIVAVVLGGTSMSGGWGGVAGSVLGVLILGLVRNIVAFADVNSWYQPLVDASIVLIALASPGLIRLLRREEIE